ncbi:transporter substrate-binding domain-containing protein [Streptococcus porcinus]|uniref:Extracellular solute-binding protein n=1 Tax=Streptococcus porcinus TaxID=1340 RepID=A0A4V0HA82_STRPO|nr:transporter substrate-binding domain-containing protein [Streptococcus porcinus]VTT43265.1 extracellular solute-binding protein [Streptococcus porcinus]VTT44753.1 extracellular solute-binding protein [Streptococcus porcinus]
MKKIYTYIALAFSVLLLTACASKKDDQGQAQWDKIAKKGELKVATSGTLFPQSFHDKKNNLTGYDVEIIKEVGKRLGLKVNFTEMGVDGMLSALNSGQVDVAGYSIEKDSKNAKKFLYTNAHKYSFGSMIVRQSDDSGIKSLKDLKGKKAAGASTTSYMKVAKKFGAKLVIYDNVTNDVYLEDVANGRTDVILNDFYLQSMASKALPDIPVKVLKGVYYNPSESNFAIKLGNEKLQKKVNQTLAEMKKDGTLTKLSKEFFAGQDVSKEKKYDFKKIDVSDVD